MDANKEKALQAALSQIERQFGKGTVMRMGEDKRPAIPSISTGSLGLDIALGIGGLPKGRVVEIYGPESSGKTTLTLQVIAEAQKAGGTCGFIDAEHALDPVYAEKLGVVVDDLILSQPDTGEQALEVTDMLVRSGAIDVLVIDSVAALTPRAEIEGEMGDTHVGLQARLMSQALRKLTSNIKSANCLVIFINTNRSKKWHSSIVLHVTKRPQTKQKFAPTVTFALATLRLKILSVSSSYKNLRNYNKVNFKCSDILKFKFKKVLM